MRFSIGVGGFGKYSAKVGPQSFVIQRNMLSMVTFSATWRWSWPDGTRMSLRYDCGRATPWMVVAADDVVCRGVESKLRWEWECGELCLLHKEAYRKMRRWRDVVRLKRRQALMLEDGSGVAAWQGTSSGVFDGVIRRCVPDSIARAVFGIIVAIYVPDTD